MREIQVVLQSQSVFYEGLGLALDHTPVLCRVNEVEQEIEESTE
jgi:hypothetical protein